MKRFDEAAAAYARAYEKFEITRRKREAFMDDFIQRTRRECTEENMEMAGCYKEYLQLEEAQRKAHENAWAVGELLKRIAASAYKNK